MSRTPPPDSPAAFDAPDPPLRSHISLPPPWNPRPDSVPTPPDTPPTPPPWSPPPRHAPLDLQPGDVVLGAWRLLYVAGEGATGATWRASPVDGGADVALKAVLTGGPGTQLHDNLLREAMLLRQLRHPTVVRYLGVIDMPATPITWLIMEWVEGGDFADWIARHAPVSPTRARFLLLQIVDALEFLHSREVVHRDLKPANILVRPTAEGPPRLCVADFGISRRTFEGAVHVTRPAGTPGYAPPEIWGPGPITCAADVFSLGAILWYLLTGHEAVPRPGEAWPRAELLSARMAQLVPADSTELATLALAMLALEPSMRPGLGELRDALERAVPSEAVSGGTLLPPPVRRSIPTPHAATTDVLAPLLRGPSLGLVVALCAGLVVVCAGAWVVFKPEPEVAVAAVAPAVVEPAVEPAERAIEAPVREEPPDPVPVRVVSTPPAEPPAAEPAPLPIGELRIGLRAPAGLPADAMLVVITPDGRITRTPSTSATVSGTRSGTAKVQVRAGAGLVAEARCELPGGDLVRLVCSAPASDFKGMHCDVR